MKFLVFQHIAVEHPGIFCHFMRENNITWDTVELDEGDSIPELSNYDALLVMGGPMDVWQIDDYPWLIAEKQAIRTAVVELHMPFLGFCLGHQLLADALGGEVIAMPQPEVGLMSVKLTEQGHSLPLFQQFETPITALQWHGAMVQTAPTDSQILASSALCNIQALQIGQCAFSMQFHLEAMPNMIAEWAKIPEYAESLDNNLGAGAAISLQQQFEQQNDQLVANARRLFNNFITVVKQAVATNTNPR